MGTVVLDANILIGFFSPVDLQHERAIDLLRPWLTAGNTVFVPASVYAEVLVHAMRVRESERIDGFLEDAGMTIVDIDAATGRNAARLRADNAALKLPDALALATALRHEATFLTLDRRLQRIAERMEG